jgi:hypothetical protein
MGMNGGVRDFYNPLCLQKSGTGRQPALPGMRYARIEKCAHARIFVAFWGVA